MNVLAEASGSLEDRIHAIHQELATAASLRPCPHVNKLFGDLVQLSIDAPRCEGVRVLADPVLRGIQESLWRVCAHGEFELELDWARRIAASDDPWATARSFPYYENYVRLTQLEALSLCGVSGRLPRSVVLIGCGPLPLTGLLLASIHGVSVRAIDVDAEASQLANAVAERLEIPHFRAHEGDALSLPATAEEEVVFLAALVGINRRDKLRVLRHLGSVMPAGALLLVRSARSLRSLLYPEIDPAALAPFVPIIEIHPHDEIINSVIIARAPLVAQRREGRAAPQPQWKKNGESIGR
jgi:nicotianamine synthase